MSVFRERLRLLILVLPAVSALGQGTDRYAELRRVIDRNTRATASRSSS
jgi:hypothetical protein